MASDRIFIRDLALRCIIGIYPEERREKQDVIINVELDVDCRPAGMSDDMADTVSYKTIKQDVRAMVEASAFLLIERLAEEVASIALRDTRVEACTVTVDKPGALRFASSAAVRITRLQRATGR